MALLTEFSGALRDIRLGWQHREGWWALSRQAIRISYRRTTLGPFWITAQQLVFVLGISLLYAQLLKTGITDLVPRVVIGVIYWGLLTGCILSTSSVFIQQSHAVKFSTLPISFHVFSAVCQQLFVFLHSGLVLVPLAFLTRSLPAPVCAITIPLSLVVVAINSFALGLWLGPLSVRFRDISAALPSVLQTAMFFSPVFWPVDLVGYQSWIIDLNPFAWMIETFRSPILTGSIQINLWIRLLMLTLLNLIVGVIALSRTRTKIAYWA